MKTNSRLLVLLILLAPLTHGCFLKSMAVDSIADSLAGTGDTFSSDNDPQLVGDAVPFSLKLMESVLSATPHHTALLTALTKSFTEYAYAYVQSNAETIADEDYKKSKEQKLRAKKLYLHARDYGLRGLETRFKGITQTIRTDPKGSVAKAKKEDVELMYWTGVSWMAAISLGKADPELVSDVPQAEALIYKAFELDPDYDKGSIYDFLITYEGGKPALMGGSAQRAKELFDAALKVNHGQSASTYVNFAEAVSEKNQNQTEFEELLNKALAIDPDKDTSTRLVNLLTQKRARWLLSREDAIFVK